MTREEFLTQEIETYRKKIETYQAMIAEWQKEIGIVPANHRGNNTDTNDGGKKNGPAAGDPLSLIQGMVFFGKSQPEAAKAFLEMAHYPLTTDKILEGLEKGGVTVGGKTQSTRKQNLYTILERSQDFVRVGKGTWAIAGWPGAPKKSTKEPEVEEKKQNGVTGEPAS